MGSADRAGGGQPLRGDLPVIGGGRGGKKEEDLCELGARTVLR